MTTGFQKFLMIGAAGILVAGCDVLWPALDAPEPTSDSSQTAPAAAPAPATAAPVAPAPTASANYVGTTAVGERIAQMQRDHAQLSTNVAGLKRRLADIRTASASSATAYHTDKAEITSRLQLGTTPGNPLLVDRWNTAQSTLDTINDAIPALSSLKSDADDEAAFGKFLLSTVQATFGLSGAVDADHQQLRGLEDSVYQSLVDLDRMLTAITDEINRHNLYMTAERADLITLASGIKNGQLLGTNISNRSFALVETAATAAAASGGPPAGAEPLVIIKFDRENVAYQQPLYNAVSQALTAKPGAVFDLVAVSPSRGNAAEVALTATGARRNAEGVLRTLTDMGVQPGRVNLLAETRDVVTNEVHIYVR